MDHSSSLLPPYESNTYESNTYESNTYESNTYEDNIRNIRDITNIVNEDNNVINEDNNVINEDNNVINEDVIDINIVDDEMCMIIWKDFKDQYRPFVTSLIRLTNPSTYNYFANIQNRTIVLNYINKRLKGIKMVKIRPIGSSYFFFVVKRIFEETITTKIDNLQSQVIYLKQVVQDLEFKLTKLYYAPGMPGYIEASNEFNEQFRLNQTDSG